jgi:hypothetical protein
MTIVVFVVVGTRGEVCKIIIIKNVHRPSYKVRVILIIFNET